MNYSKKTVWVTGASSGIGKSICREIAKKGANLVISSRRVDELNSLKSELEKSGIKVLVLELDLKKQSNFKEKFEEVLKEFSSIDLLINNGGISQRSLVTDTSSLVDRNLMEVNFFGTVALTKVVLPHMIKNGGGQIAAVSSIVGKFGFPLRSAYSASKHALHGFFESLRAENVSNNISVTMIIPGRIKTNISKNALLGDGEIYGKMDQGQDLGMSSEKASEIIVRGLEKEKKEILVGKKEILMVHIRRFLPSLYYKLASKVKAV